MSPRLRLACACAFLLFGLLPPTAARADSGEELESLLEQPIVSTPSKQTETAALAPATTTIITAEQLRTFGIRSLDEAIDYLSLGMITSHPLHAVEIGARGVQLTADYGNHVLLMIDGNPVNEPWNGTAYFERGAGVPFELVDHIEVILGPGSVMYGSQAMLGVINIVTKRARDFAGLHLIAEGDTQLPQAHDGSIQTSPLGAWGHGVRGSVGYGSTFTLFGEPSELTLQAEYYRNDGPHWQLGPQVWGDDSITGRPKSWGPRGTPGTWGGTTLDQHYTLAPDAYLKLQIGDVVATLRGSLYQRATPYLDSIINSAGDFDDPNGRERDRFLQSSVMFSKSLSSRVVIGSRFYGEGYDYRWFNNREAAEDCPNGFSNGCRRRLLGEGVVGGGDLHLSYSIPAARAVTLLGIEGRVRHIGSELQLHDYATGSSAPAQNHYTQTDGLIAPYLQQSLSPTDWLDLNAGLRLDHDTRFGSKLSPRGAIGITPWHEAHVKLIYAEAFRAPTAYELNYADPADQVVSPNLGPESVRSLEASAEQRFGMHRLFFGVFRSWWFDMVGYATLDDAQTTAAIAAGQLAKGATEAFRYENLGTIDNYGLNAGYEGAALRRHQLQFGVNLTEAYTRVHYGSDPSQPMTVSPSLFGNARVSYAFGGDAPTLGLAAVFLAKRPADRAYDGGFSVMPYAPADLELRTTVSGHLPGVERLRYRLSVSFASAAHSAYVIGPYLYAVDATTRAELAPMTRLQGFLGLEYVLF